VALVLRIYVRGQGCGAFPSFFFYFLFLFLFSFLDVRRSCIFVLYVITHGAGKATQISYLISAAECWVSFFVQPRSELQLEHDRSLAMKYAQRPYPCLMAACVYVVAASNGTMTPPPKRNAPRVPQTPNASAASWRRTISPASTSHQPPSTVHRPHDHSSARPPLLSPPLLQDPRGGLAAPEALEPIGTGVPRQNGPIQVGPCAVSIGRRPLQLAHGKSILEEKKENTSLNCYVPARNISVWSHLFRRNCQEPTECCRFLVCHLVHRVL